ncbi:vitellogenin-1-like [Ischnura elegans]|uniref:vitellogenin-1-like n=1 Tax=Ischnura elegans TaxID=197161 RepID=UPI001ED8949C|nr:vitellogenin-1-like [Ischnura elegans]
MRTILILCLLGGVFADYDWRPRQDYRFQLEGRSLAGVSSLTQQFTGIHYRGTLLVQSQASDVLAMKLQNMTYTKVHTELKGGWWDNIPDSGANYNPLPLSEGTFIAKLNKGRVESLVVSRKLPDWQVNFLQGVAAQLQLDLSGTNAIRRRLSSNVISGRDTPPAVFTAMEDSVTGRCEVLYEISPLPGFKTDNSDDLCGSRPLLEITKTRNHSNCEVNPEYHFGFPGTMRCQPSGNQCGKFWTRSTVTRTIGCGSRSDLLMLESTTSNRIFANLHLHNGTRAEANSYQNATLISVRSMGKKLMPPSDPLNIARLQYKFTQGTAKTRNCIVSSKATKSPQQERDRTLPFDETPAQFSDEERDKQRFKRKSRSKKKNSQSKKSKSEEVAKASSEESSQGSSEEDWDPSKGLWENPSSDGSHPQPLPFDALSLALGKFGEKPCLSQHLRDLVADIANDLESHELTVDKATLRKLQLATKVCRNMNLGELKAAVGALMDPNMRHNWMMIPERKVIRDIMVMCGTDPAFEMIASWIEERKVKGDEAANMISYVPLHLTAPSKRTVDRFHELIRNAATKDDYDLRTASLLAFSNVLRVACVNQAERKMRYPTNVYGDPCPADSASRYIPYLASQLRADPALKPAVLMALGNTGSLLALPTLTAAARDSSSTPYLRARAITAMKHLVLSEPRATAPVLLSLYGDKQMPELVRLTAVSMLFFSKPTMPVWHRIAVGTWFEKSSSIRKFIWTSLKAFADSTNGMMAEQSAAAAAVLPLARPSGYQNKHYMDTFMLSKSISDLQEVLQNHVILFGGITGSHAYMRQTNRIAGFSEIKFEADMWMSNPDAFIRSMMHFFSPIDDRAEVRPPIQGLNHATHWLRETLKIAPRAVPKMEGDIQWRLQKLVETMTVLTKGKVAEWTKAAKQLPEDLKNGLSYHKQHMYGTEIEFSTTTETGFPVSFKVYNPWMLRATGKATLNQDQAKRITAEMSFLYGEELDAELSVYTPFDGVEHVAAHQSSRLFTPPSTRITGARNQTGDAYKVSMWPLTNFDRSKTVYKEINRPFTMQRDASKLSAAEIDRNAKEIHFEDTTGGEMSPMSSLTFKFNRDLETSPVGQMNFSPQNPLFVMGHMILWPSLAASTVELQMKNFDEVTLEIGLGRASANPDGIDGIQMHEWTGHNSAETVGESAYSTPTPVGDTTTEMPSTTEEPTETTTDQIITLSPIEVPIEAPGPGSQEQQISSAAFQVFNINTDSPVGEFNASTMDVFGAADSGSRIRYILEKSLTGIRSGRSYVVGLEASAGGSPRNSSASMYLGMARETGGRLTRVAIFMKNANGTSLGMTQVLSFPATPLLSLEEMLRSNLSSRLYVDVTKSGSDPLSIKGSMVRSARKAAVLYNKREAHECMENGYNLQPECRAIFEEAGAIDRYNFTLYMKEGFNSAANSYVLSALKYWYYPYITEVRPDEAGSDDQASITVDVCRSNNCVNGVLRMPDNTIHFDRVPTNARMTSTALLSPLTFSFPNIKVGSSCSLEQKRLVTFDGEKFEAHLSNCWHLMAKDCSGVSRMAVLVQKNNNGTELEVNVDNYRVLRLLPGPRAEVNGQPVDIDVNKMAEVSDLANTTLMVITRGVDQAIGVKLPSHGLDIIYADSGALLVAERSLRGRLCGLCGDYDGQLVDEFKKPDNGVARSVKEFVTSYELKSADQCDKN